MPRRSNSKSSKAKTPAPAKAKPADPTEAEAQAEADQTAEDLAAALETGGTNPEPASEEAKAAAKDKQEQADDEGPNIHAFTEETDALRDDAREQSRERREAAGEEDVQPSATFAENEPENPVDRDEIEEDVPRPKVFSSADLTNSPTEPTATQSKLAGMRAPEYRPPSATERKLAQQGIIPPYRE